MDEINILPSKIQIPLHQSSLLDRPRLHTEIQSGIHRKLTLISAPAGYGKSTLLSQWAHQQNAACAWLSLNAYDNHPRQFYAYFIAAFSKIIPKNNQALITSSNEIIASLPSSPVNTLEFQTRIIYFLHQETQNCIFVLDDFHLITNPRLYKFLTFLLENKPSNFHLILSTRSDPPLPLSTYRAKGQLSEIRAKDLKFSHTEITTFFDKAMNLDLTKPDILALANRTEGWIAGLQLAAISMQDKEDLSEFVQNFTGSNRFILDYLVEEVLLTQEPEIQQFLLTTSILKRMIAPLCDYLLSEPVELIESQNYQQTDMVSQKFTRSQTILEHLEKINLFINPLDEKREWYRYHQLFSDLLQKKLKDSNIDINRLHRKASVWYSENENLFESIEHAFQAKDYQQVLKLIELYADQFLSEGKFLILYNWFKRIPRELIHDHARLDLYFCATMVFAGKNIEDIIPTLNHIEESHPQFTPEVLILRAYILIFQASIPRAEKLAQNALTQIKPDKNFFYNTAKWIVSISRINIADISNRIGILEEITKKSFTTDSPFFMVASLCQLAETRISSGQLHEAKATYQKAIDIATDENGIILPIAGQALIGLGIIHLEWNDPIEALSIINKGIDLIKKWQPFAALDGYMASALCLLALKRDSEAIRILDIAADLAERFDTTEVDDRIVALVRAQIELRQGNTQAIDHYLNFIMPQMANNISQNETQQRSGSETDRNMDQRFKKYEDLALARARIHQGKLDKGKSILNNLIPSFKKEHRVRMLIETHILLAIIFQKEGDSKKAKIMFEYALGKAVPGGFIRLFLDEGHHISSLIQMSISNEVYPNYCKKLYKALQLEPWYPSKIIPPTNGLPEILSEREIDVLQSLNTSMSVIQIAEKLFVAESTIRSHIKSIYRKLNVHNRMDAIQKARALDLLLED
ncbi:MAG: hypothetical protein JEZ06_14055 [Anaerolineaceae bacterium]|nr:hypothetical protein [Anaerolineaceae bacterium]